MPHLAQIYNTQVQWLMDSGEDELRLSARGQQLLEIINKAERSKKFQKATRLWKPPPRPPDYVAGVKPIWLAELGQKLAFSAVSADLESATDPRTLEMDSAAPRHSLSRGVGEQGPSQDLAPPRPSPTEKKEDIEVKEPEAEILDMEGSTAAREHSVSRGAGEQGAWDPEAPPP